MEETFKVVRYYFSDDMDSEVILTGLTLEQAQAHCQNPQTSSQTATVASAVRRTEKYGPWFDGYTSEKPR